jgi:hypothetical protein
MAKRLAAYWLLLALVAGAPLPTGVCSQRPVVAAACRCEPAGITAAQPSHCLPKSAGRIATNCCRFNSVAPDRQLSGIAPLALNFRVVSRTLLGVGQGNSEPVPQAFRRVSSPPDLQALLCLFLN